MAGWLAGWLPTDLFSRHSSKIDIFRRGAVVDCGSSGGGMMIHCCVIPSWWPAQ